ncbi:MAG: galactokinase [Opitutales bacterium]|nr:galactokinase [Opitutales bacterium]
MDKFVPQSELIEKVESGFHSHFGRPATHYVASPGRLNVIGEHVDYAGGYVLPAAIERWIVAAFRANEDGVVRIWDVKFEDKAEFDPNAPLKAEPKSWLNYPKGVFAQFQKIGWEIPGFDICMFSNVPTGGGLSSSAALEALFATVVEELNGKKLDKMEKALLCQKAEHEYAGVPCGIMDQAAVILSEKDCLLQLNCKDLTIETVPFTNPEIGLLIIDSNVHHELVDGEYEKRRNDCEQAASELGVELLCDATVEQVNAFEFSNSRVRRRALHVVNEIQRNKQMEVCLQNQDYAKAGKLIQQSHNSLQYRFEVSCPELDFIAGLCNSLNGVYGARMMGGGFGGSVIAMIEMDQADEIAATVESRYKEQFDINAAVFLTRPAQGVTCETF